jgi:superfamily I DNA/RNA helicase
MDALLDGLNPAQRSAATYGIEAEEGTPPLLIAAGAGTGKTKTLAHRVARLILGGADPHRLLLLTFTRRAALEMTRRAQHILVASQRGRAAGGAEPVLLPWSGTFHSIGNRLLRRHAATLSLEPAFTVLDRADTADLMDLVRSDLGLARTRSRFPKKGTCLAIYSYSVNAGCPLEETLVESFPWCDEWEAELKRLFAAYVAAKQRDNVLCCCIGTRPYKCPASPRRCGRTSTTSWLTSIRTRTGCKPRSFAHWRPMAQGSPWSATTPSRSMPFVPRRCGTSSIFPISSHRERR